MIKHINNIPEINIQEGTFGEVSIIKNKHIFELYHNETLWHGLNTKNKREIYEQWSSYDLAYGNVLLTGFGFGYTALWVASKPEVKSVTVIEISQDVVDAFLLSNVLPDNISIIIADVNTFDFKQKYDCVIFDHFNFLKDKQFYIDLSSLAKKIPHDLFWFWSLEMFYIRHYYNISETDLYVAPVDFNKFNFLEKWDSFKEDMGISSIPSLSKDAISSYIDVYFLRHLIQ